MNASSVLFKNVKNGDITTVQILIDEGANVHSRNEAGETPLITAVYEGQKKMVEVLLVNGANVNDKDFYLGRTALWFAERIGHSEIIELLKYSGGEEFVFED